MADPTTIDISAATAQLGLKNAANAFNSSNSTTLTANRLVEAGTDGKIKTGNIGYPGLTPGSGFLDASMKMNSDNLSIGTPANLFVDHVHPRDTSKLNAASPQFTGNLSGDTASIPIINGVKTTTDGLNVVITADGDGGKVFTIDETVSIFDKAPKDNPIFTGTVTIPETPVNATDAASKGYVDGKYLKAYASIYLSDGNTAQTIPKGDTYTKVTAYTDNGLFANCTPDAANDKITITQNGVYSVAYMASYRSGTNNVTFRGAVFLDGVEQDNIHSGGQMGLAGAMRSTACSGFINVTDAPKDIDVRIKHDQGGDVSITHVYANLNIEKIG